MVTLSFFLKNSTGKKVPSVCFAVTFGTRTLSLLMDVGADNAFRVSCRAGTEPPPTTIRQHLEPAFPREGSSERAPN